MNVLVYGAGQLAQMMYLAGAPLNLNVLAVDVANKTVVHPVEKTVLPQSLEQAINDADVLTVEFEHVPEELLLVAEESGKLSPNLQSILVGADRVREKHLLESLNIANCEHEIITDIAQLDGISERLGEKIIFKSSRDGYDGYGQWRSSTAADLPELKTIFTKLDLHKVPIVAEKMCPFTRELSLLGARNESGEIVVYPLAQNTHHEGQLHTSIAPAPLLSEALQAQALDIFTRLAEKLEYVGVLAVELFEHDGVLLVNELAPRVHNSGHWSMHGADTCQFENHLRAVCALPLGSTEHGPAAAMINIIGCNTFSKNFLSISGVHFHWYGKTVREKRKMGHINVTANSYADLADKFGNLSEYLPMEFFPKLLADADRIK